MGLISQFFHGKLSQHDPEIYQSIEKEDQRQQNHIELIASENIVSRSVMEALGTVMTNKYAEGYPSNRYYGGCECVDVAESLAIERLTKLFQCKYANVQPHSGAQANGAVMLALLKPNDTILGMDLNAGGHLTHGAKPAQSGKWFNAIHYGVCPQTHLIDYDQVEELAKKHQPKLIIAGASSYPRIIDFKRFRQIADQVGAYLMVDMAHISGLVAGGQHPSPLNHAHIVTSTTHKTLRGPRGGIILSQDLDLGKKINSAVFPGLQGGPLMNVIAAKAVAFKEALEPSFKTYAQNVVNNAQALAQALKKRGISLIAGGTDNHLVLLDLTNKNVTGKQSTQALEQAHIICNKNAIPFDKASPHVTSGIRLGTPAGTTRGFGEREFDHIGHLISDVLDSLTQNEEKQKSTTEKVRNDVMELCRKFPIYHHLSA